jgi:hypothetical protein
MPLPHWISTRSSTRGPAICVLSVAWVGGAASLGLLAIGLLVQAHHAGGVHVAMRTSAMVAGCFFTGEAAKWLLGKLHPLADVIDHTWAESFPSVHTAVAMVLALGLARLTPGKRTPIAVLYAIALGTFTVLAGWHFPSDVVGGCLLGAAWAVGIVPPRGVRSTHPAALAAAAGAALLAVGLLAGYGRSFGAGGIASGPFATGALAIAAAATAAAALSSRGARNPRPSSGVGTAAPR